MPVKPRPALERFEEKIMCDGVSTCWHWVGGSNPHYGSFALDASRRSPKRVLAHRFAYETYVGPITGGLHIDHICRNKLCVNPAHLRLVTRSENMMAIPREIRAKFGKATHCKHGHEFSPENTKIIKGKYGPERACLICRRMHERRHRERKAAAVGKVLGSWKKLSAEQVAELRAMVAVANGKYGEAARHFGISTAQAWRIANYQRRSA